MQASFEVWKLEITSESLGDKTSKNVRLRFSLFIRSVNMGINTKHKHDN